MRVACLVALVSRACVEVAAQGGSLTACFVVRILTNDRTTPPNRQTAVSRHTTPPGTQSRPSASSRGYLFITIPLSVMHREDRIVIMSPYLPFVDATGRSDASRSPPAPGHHGRRPSPASTPRPVASQTGGLATRGRNPADQKANPHFVSEQRKDHLETRDTQRGDTTRDCWRLASCKSENHAIVSRLHGKHR